MEKRATKVVGSSADTTRWVQLGDGVVVDDVVVDKQRFIRLVGIDTTDGSIRNVGPLVDLDELGGALHALRQARVECK